jgi:transcription termination factor Rho
MSAKPRKADVEEVLEAKAAAGTPEKAETPKRRPGRPRKNAATEEAAAETRPAPARNRRKKADEAVQEDTEVQTPLLEGEAETEDSTPEAAPRGKRAAPARQSRSRRGRTAAEDTGDDSQAARSDADDSAEEQDDSRRGDQRSRRGRGGNRRQSLNYRDLQQKIVPELHLLAKEVGLEEYRQMEKDELAIAVLERSTEAEGLKLVKGYLEISSDGYGFLQESLLQNNTRSVIVSAGLIKQFKLRTGDFILGKARKPRDNERYGTLIRVEAVNNVDPFQAAKRPRFDDLIPIFPERMIRLETEANELSARVIDLLAPIGRGQRGLIVAPPKAGKTTLLKKIANSVIQNEPDIKVIVLLVDERPEEVTDFRDSVTGVEVIASTFDEPPQNHIRVAEFVHERARRIVEEGGHVMILLDSITRLARANNLVTPPTGRTLSGGLDSSALHWPKRFLGAARNIRGGGSLSILATALVETGSRMDDVIFEEFKGTGNMELHLARRLEERRIFPAIDILKSGTRREELLLGEATLAKMWLLRKVISDMDAAEAMEMLLGRLSRTKSNEEFLATLSQG